MKATGQLPQAKLRRRMCRVIPFALALLPTPASPAAAQDLTTWLNARIDELVAARLEQQSGARETEAPALAHTSSAIVNESGFADLIGIALSGPRLGEGPQDEANGTPMAVTITPYSVLAGLLGVDPTNPFTYEQRSAWRALSLTFGTETMEDANGVETRASLLGLKLKVWSRRNPSPGSEVVNQLQNTLGIAATAAGALGRELIDSLHTWAGAFAGHAPSEDPTINQERRASFNNTVLRMESLFPGILNFVGPERVNILLAIIEARIDPFLANRRAADAVLSEIKGAPQLAMDVQSRLLEAGDDEVRLGLALDVGMAPRTQLTANAAATFVNSVDGEDDATGATLAAQLSLALGPDRLTGADPASLQFALESQFLDGQRPRWRAQGKLALPLLQGLAMPISVTWSNEASADGGDAVGQITFAADTSLLLRALRGR